MSEAYRKAMAAGDHIAAARAIQDAVSGDYDSGVIDRLHAVARMSSAERAAEPDPEPRPVQQISIATQIFGWRRGR